MKTLSNLIGKPIISIYNGKIEGYVKNLLFDKKLTKLCFLQFFDDNTQEEKLLNVKSIYSIGQDAIILKNSFEIILDTIDESNYINPNNFQIYSVAGNKIGKVADITLNDKNKIENLVLQDKTKLLLKNILNVGDRVIILKEGQSKLKISDFKSKTNIIKYSKSNIKVEIQNGVTVIKPQKPNKVIANNYEFLIGRKTNKNIYADNGELLVKKQTKISTNIIDVVCRNGKLKELTANSIQ
ncbi:MAG: PRC-barrel domain-containing protein [Christensenellales bacterium]